MVVARREEGKRDVIEHLLLFLTPLARPHAATFQKVIHTETRTESEHGQKKNNVVFSEEPARSMSGGGYIKQRYAMIPVKLSLLLLIFAAWSRFVQSEKKKYKNTKNKIS